DLPKAELHLHLGGSYPKEYLRSIASDEQMEALEKGLEQMAQGVDYRASFPFFSLITRLVDTEEKVKKGTQALCLALKEDNVRYVEIRTGLKNLGRGFEAYLVAVLEGLEAEREAAFDAKLILSLQRSSSPESAQETVDLALKYRHLGVVGIDISGDALIGRVETILPILVNAKQAGLPFVIHMGESPDETDQMLLLTALEPARIGHGVYLEPEARKWMLAHQTPLEVCLTSSVLTQMISSHEEHFGNELYQLGHPIVLCSDDPLLFSTHLSQEFSLAKKHMGLSVEEIENLSRKAFEYRLY
ncbi:MAG: hypothetical protein JSS61_00800, partial [Verrucomicrobia bacterium]|nr:hypothetical protein [Verrucomicrobiota bacterium]